MIDTGMKDKLFWYWLLEDLNTRNLDDVNSLIHMFESTGKTERKWKSYSRNNLRETSLWSVFFHLLFHVRLTNDTYLSLVYSAYVYVVYLKSSAKDDGEGQSYVKWGAGNFPDLPHVYICFVSSSSSFFSFSFHCSPSSSFSFYPTYFSSSFSFNPTYFSSSPSFSHHSLLPPLFFLRPVEPPTLSRSPHSLGYWLLPSWANGVFIVGVSLHRIFK